MNAIKYPKGILQWCQLPFKDHERRARNSPTKSSLDCKIQENASRVSLPRPQGKARHLRGVLLHLVRKQSGHMCSGGEWVHGRTLKEFIGNVQCEKSVHALQIHLCTQLNMSFDENTPCREIKSFSPAIVSFIAIHWPVADIRSSKLSLGWDGGSREHRGEWRGFEVDSVRSTSSLLIV